MSDAPNETPEVKKPEATEAAEAAAEKTAPPKAATATADKPAAGAEAKPAAPVEPPFTVDPLLSSTARYTHKAWHLFYSNRKDMTFIRETPVRATLEARSATGAEELQKLLTEANVKSISRNDRTLSFTATFEQIQTIIRHPQTYLLDVVKI